jgi:polar amino acid transport system permease protein
LVIIPQAVTLMLAPFGNLMIVLLKGTSLVSLITVTDLTFAAQSLRAAEGRTALVLFLVLVIYFALSMLISWAVHALEARFKARYSLELPAPPSLVSAGETP